MCSGGVMEGFQSGRVFGGEGFGETAKGDESGSDAKPLLIQRTEVEEPHLGREERRRSARVTPRTDNQATES